MEQIYGADQNQVKKYKKKQGKIKKKLSKVGITFCIGILALLSIFVKPIHQEYSVPTFELASTQLDSILENRHLYPEAFIDLALKKEETIPFVYNYIENHSSSRNQNIDISDDYKKGEFPLFLQWDERWGYDLYGDNYMAINGCGPTTLSMVLVGLTGDTDLNPKVLAEFGEKNGYYVHNVGTSWSFMTEGVEQFGILGEELSLSKQTILSTLKSGKPIIASMGPGSFTSGGHFVLLTGVTQEGKIKINDSDSKMRSSQVWNISVFLDEAKNLWSFSAV